MNARDSTLEDLGAELFAEHNVYEGLAFAHHCRRLAAFGAMLLAQKRVEIQNGALELLSYVHDLGLLRPDIEGPSYMHRSLSILRHRCASYFDAQGGAFGLSAREIEELMLLNHRVLPLAGATPIAELYRQAVWVEHSRGILRFGLSHGAVREVFRRFPRLDLDRVLLDFGRRTMRKEPLTLVRGVFFGVHPEPLVRQ